MALLRPRVRKEYEHLLQPLRGDLLREHLDCVMADHAHVRELPGFERQQQPADAGPMDLDTEEIPLGMGLRQRRQVLTVAETDLERAWRRAPVECVRRERLGRELDPVLRP